jgi:two-component system, NarL family, response regulator LiaR
MINVSIVEENYFFSEIIVNALQSHELINIKGIFFSAETAKKYLIYDNPDVVIFDIETNGRNGIELMLYLVASLPRALFLVHTSHYDEATIFKAFSAGASGYLLKNVECSGISQSVIELYNGGSPISPMVARKLITRLANSSKLPDEQNLTIREKEVLNQLAKGLLYKEIAKQMAISTFTVKNHLKNIYRKLQVQNKVEALNKYKTSRI